MVRPIAHVLPEQFAPPALHALLARLEGAGFAAALVGGCVRDALLGIAVREFDVTTAAPPDALLQLFPRAIPTGLRHGTVTVPTAAGPVDVTSHRAGPRLEDDLAHRDFTVNAIAWRHAALIDPFDGLGDLQQARLRAVGDARARLTEDPLRALRAVRLVSCLGFEPDEPLREAVAAAAPTLSRVARERVRQELDRLLLGPHVERALCWLRASGLEAEIVAGGARAPASVETSDLSVSRGLRDDAAAVVAALPPELGLRYAGWLRGTRARDVLTRLRASHRRVDEVTRLLRLHPIDSASRAGARARASVETSHLSTSRAGARARASVETSHLSTSRGCSDAEVRRLMLRVGDAALDGLLALRRAELRAAGGGAEASARLEWLALAIDRARARGAITSRAGLALDGNAVMGALHCAPGERVGAALRWLEDRVTEDPTCNTADGLRALLAGWQG